MADDQKEYTLDSPVGGYWKVRVEGLPEFGSRPATPLPIKFLIANAVAQAAHKSAQADSEPQVFTCNLDGDFELISVDPVATIINAKRN